MILRDYQQAAIDSLWAWWAAGRQGEHPLICLPTGSGKTVVFSALLRRLFAEYPGQVSALVLAHRKELISQAESKLLATWPGAPVGVYSAALKRKQIRPITIAARDTIAPVIDKCGKFTFVLVDEAHLINQKEAGRYRDIIARLTRRNPDLVVIGFTATPFRLGQGRIYGPGKLFAGLAYQARITDLIAAGYLANITSMSGRADSLINLDGVKTTAGDFNQAQLAERSTDDAVVEAALEDWKAKAFDAGRKCTVFFCVTRLHAQMVSEKLARMGIDCPVVSGETPAAERDAILAGIDCGEFPAIANVGILTEGWDCTRVDCIALLRPTQSAALYVQMVGRGLRLHPGKTDCLVLDYGGNIIRLGAIDEASEPEPTQRKKAAPAEQQPKICGTWQHADMTGPSRWIGGCGQDNAPSARFCKRCLQPFPGHVTHSGEATEGGILSTERRVEEFEVEDITATVRHSRTTGRAYLRLDYRSGLMEHFYKNLMLGYEGFAGSRAAREWRDITGSHLTPATPEDALAALDSGAASLRPVRLIRCDMGSKYKDIVQIEYDLKEREAA